MTDSSKRKATGCVGAGNVTERPSSLPRPAVTSGPLTWRHTTDWFASLRSRAVSRTSLAASTARSAPAFATAGTGGSVVVVVVEVVVVLVVLVVLVVVDGNGTGVVAAPWWRWSPAWLRWWVDGVSIHRPRE